MRICWLTLLVACSSSPRGAARQAAFEDSVTEIHETKARRIRAIEQAYEESILTAEYQRQLAADRAAKRRYEKWHNCVVAIVGVKNLSDGEPMPYDANADTVVSRCGRRPD